jgi:hypothetical protein
MFKLNFDLFYELNHGSVVSVTHSNDRLGIDSTSFYRVRNSTLEVKYVDHTNDKIYDWHNSDCVAFHPNSVLKIEERFARNLHG